MFALTNLLPAFPGRSGKGDDFPLEEARARAVDLHRMLGDECWDRVLLLGGDVARAMGLEAAPRLRWLAPTTGDPSPAAEHPARPGSRLDRRRRDDEAFYSRGACFDRGEWLVPGWAQGLLWPDARFAVMPHPSGVSRWWNAPAHVEEAGAFMRALAAEVCTTTGAALASGSHLSPG